MDRETEILAELHAPEPEDRYTYWGDRLVLAVAVGAMAAYLLGVI